MTHLLHGYRSKNINDLVQRRSKETSPLLLAEFDNDWIYLNNVQKKLGGYTDVYNFRNGVMCVDYFNEEYRFRWGSKKDLYNPEETK